MILINHISIQRVIMKKILFILVTFLMILPISSYADHHQDKSIIFYLDMNVAPEKAENLDKFVAYLSETVERTESGTTYYKYFISADKTKVSLLEVYQDDAAALFHVKSFLKAVHRDEFLDTFEITNFQVLGESSEELKLTMMDFTNDHRTLIDGYKRK